MMGQTLVERIQYDAAYDRNLIFNAYAGDLADLVAELTARAERAEAALRTALDSKEFFRVCWEKAEAELAAVPIDALRQIAECERRLLPPTPQLIALNAWLATLPSDNDLSPDDPAA